MVIHQSCNFSENYSGALAKRCIVGCIVWWMLISTDRSLIIEKSTHTHTLNPFSPKISIPTLVLLENTWCRTHKGLGFETLLVLVSDAFSALPTGTTRTEFWPCCGEIVEAWVSAITLAATSHAILSKSPEPAFTGLTPHGSWPHQGTVRPGSQSLCPWFGPGVLMLAQLPDVALQKVRWHSRMETSVLCKAHVSKIVTEGMPGWIFTL